MIKNNNNNKEIVMIGGNEGGCLKGIKVSKS